jgi:heme exporter protein D
MPHTPFILAAYLITTVVLLWVALAPVLSNYNLVRQLKARQLKARQQGAGLKHRDKRQ